MIAASLGWASNAFYIIICLRKFGVRVWPGKTVLATHIGLYRNIAGNVPGDPSHVPPLPELFSERVFSAHRNSPMI